MNFQKAIELITRKLQHWLDYLIQLLPNFVLALIVFFVGIFLARKIRNLVRRAIYRMAPTSTVGALAVNTVYILGIAVVIFSVLRILHLDGTVTTMLAGVGVVGLALAFAFQDIAANFISGIFISFRKPFFVGDVIKVKDFVGNVTEIRLRDTTILTAGGQYVILPNKDVFQSPIENFTRLGKRRLEIKGGVSQADDLKKAQRLALEALSGLPGILKDQTTFLYSGLGESTIDFTIYLWVDIAGGGGYNQVLNDAIIAIKESFEQNDISLPFPIRTLDFGMKGGKTLKDMGITFK